MPASKILLIDGYNVIHRIPELAAALAGGLESARRRLALVVSTWRQRHPGVECKIVFDGDHRFAGGRPQAPAGIPAVFTRTSHGADAEIIRLVREYAGSKAEITVVSDDNSVRNGCRAHGAAVEPAAFILSVRTRSSPVSITKSSRDGKGLGGKAAADVTAELKKKYGI